MKWGPLALVGAWLAKEATHIHHHIVAPKTLALCVLAPVVVCACAWCRKRWRARKYWTGWLNG